jgi:antagonist of KipI
MTQSGSQPALEVLDPGLLLTVQDGGRRGFEHLGVPRAGAADARSLALANQLVGNSSSSAGLEATLVGPRLRALRDVVIAITGADLDPVVQAGHRTGVHGRGIRLAAGEVLEFQEPGDPERGCRAYIAVGGGIDVPVVLGSRSTSLVGGFGGFDGRALRVGDVLLAAVAPTSSASVPFAGGPASGDVQLGLREPIRVLPGPASREPDGERRLRALLETTWRVALDSDRRGLRLEPALGATFATGAGPSDADRPSQGVVLGTIQLATSGQPLVLMPDAGTTGGYPVIAVVVSADLPTLGQLAPMAEVRFGRFVTDAPAAGVRPRIPAR